MRTLTPDLAAELTCPVRASGEPVPVHAPFTGDVLARVPQCTAADVAAAYDRARDAQRRWAARPAGERAAPVRRLAELLLRRRAEAFDLLQWETGKARIDAMYEIGEAALVAAFHARHSERLLQPRRHPGALPLLTRVMELRKPKGVIAVITPWNFPLALAVADAVPALLAGNAVVMKPDTQTALTTLWLRALAAEAGLPAELWQVVPGAPAEVGDALLDGADHVAFTGSTATGRLIGAGAGRRLVGASLELGGKNPMVVLPDANLRTAAAAVPRACFGNAGQLCMTVERLYVHSSVLERFLGLVDEQVRRIRMGAALDFSADMGSLTTPALLERVTGQVAQARELGATVRCGGRPRPDIGPLFHEPTVLTDVPDGATLHRGETFGPVVSVYPYDDVDRAVALANDSEYGLTASVWGADRRAARQTAARIRAGAVNVNDGYAAAFASHSAPMGGMKASGLGRRHGRDGLLRYTEAQTVATQRGIRLDARLGLPRALHAEVLGRVLGVLRRRSGGRP